MEEWIKSMFELPMKARISIVRIQGREVCTNSAPIYIHEVGTDGLKFMSDLKFPILAHVLLKFEFTFFKQIFSLYGHVVARNDMDHSFFEYDIQHEEEQPEQESFFKLMKHMAHRYPYLEIYRKTIDQSAVVQAVSSSHILARKQIGFLHHKHGNRA